MPDAPVLLAGRYRLGASLGRGGMGQVFLARDETLERDVAIKEIDQPLGADGGASARRTLREARAAARINHPNVIQVYDVLQLDDRTWIVMEYVPCRSLREEIAEQGRLDPYRVARIGLELLGALRTAHRLGVEHRDVKPANVLLADDGRVLLTDFGIAAVDDDGVISRSDILVGSPQFMAPERAQGAPSGLEADLWSLGATLYAAIEGHSPYQRGSTMATLAALATEEPDPPAHAGVLRPLLDGLLQKDPATRMTAEDAENVARAVLTDLSASGETPGDQQTRPSGLAGFAASLPSVFRIPRPRSSGERSSGSGSRSKSARATPSSGADVASGRASVSKTRADAARADAARADAARAEAVRVEAAKVEAAKAEAARAEAARAEAAKVEAAKVEAAKAEAAKAGAAKAEAAKAEAAKVEAAKADAASLSVAGSATAESDVAAAEAEAAPAGDAEAAAKSDAAKSDAAKSDAAKSDAGKAKPAKRGTSTAATPDGGLLAGAAVGEPGGDGHAGSADVAATKDTAGDAPADGAHAAVPEDSEAGTGPKPAVTTKPEAGTGLESAVTAKPDAGTGPEPESNTTPDAGPAPEANIESKPAKGREANRTVVPNARRDARPVVRTTAAMEVEPPLADTKVNPGPPAIGRGRVSSTVTGTDHRRRGLIVVVAAALAVVLVAGAVWALTGRTGSSPEAQPTASAAAPPVAGTTGATSPAPSAPADAAKPSPGPVDSAGAGEGDGGNGNGRPQLPAGWVEYTDRTGFSLYVPAGWNRSRSGTMVYFRGDGKVLGIDQTDEPKSNPVKDWRNQADNRVAGGDFPQYDEVHIKAVDYFIKAADWEFMFTRDGSRRHVNNRGTVVADDKAYGFWWETADSEWSDSRDDLQLVFDSFVPAK